MRDPARILRVIAKLKQVWEMNPDMRLGQLYLNLMRDEVSGGTLRDIWNVEDDLLERRLNAYLKDGAWSGMVRRPSNIGEEN